MLLRSRERIVNMCFLIPDCPETYRDKDTHRHIDPKIHRHTHAHTELHTLGSVLVYSFILGTLCIQVCLSQKRKKQRYMLLPIFHACISYIRDWWFMLFSSPLFIKSVSNYIFNVKKKEKREKALALIQCI